VQVENVTGGPDAWGDYEKGRDDSMALVRDSVKEIRILTY
jgi:hypothetical protein